MSFYQRGKTEVLKVVSFRVKTIGELINFHSHVIMILRRDKWKMTTNPRPGEYRRALNLSRLKFVMYKLHDQRLQHYW